jgi:hypothetical protein
MKSIAIMLLLTLAFNLNAQNGASKEIIGIIVQANSDSVLAYVHVINKRTLQGDVSDELGRFIVLALSGDTLRFSSIGYKELLYVVSSDSIIQVEMVLDVTILPEQIVYALPKNLLTLRQALNHLVIHDSTDVFKENMEKAGFKAPPIHPVTPKVTALNPISFFYDKVVEKIKERKIKSDLFEIAPKLE